VARPEIIGSSRSSYTRVVCMVGEEKGIDYVLTEVELGAPEICAVHPFGKMPVLRHGDFQVCGSKAIATISIAVFRARSSSQSIRGLPRLPSNESLLSTR